MISEFVYKLLVNVVGEKVTQYIVELIMYPMYVGHGIVYAETPTEIGGYIFLLIYLFFVTMFTYGIISEISPSNLLSYLVALGIFGVGFYVVADVALNTEFSAKPIAIASFKNGVIYGALLAIVATIIENKLIYPLQEESDALVSKKKALASAVFYILVSGITIGVGELLIGAILIAFAVVATIIVYIVEQPLKHNELRFTI